jgi:MoaA/NifB/PqqE/SkfB family radical SAM enzyme
MEEDRQNMSLEDFKWLMDMVERDSIKGIGILGGEPTLNPHFFKMLDLALQNKSLNNIRLFTNGIFNDEILQKILNAVDNNSKNVSVILNYNEPEVLGEKRHAIVLKNIEAISKTGHLSLSWNLYRANQPFNYLIDACLKYGINHIRWSPAIPNQILSKEELMNYYKEILPTAANFMDTVLKKNIPSSGVDCIFFPMCTFDEETSTPFVNIVKAGGINNINGKCDDRPIVDVKPDMTIIRCFAFSEVVANIKDFASFNDIIDYFKNKIDSKIDGLPFIEDCKECDVFKKKGRSCVCKSLFKKDVGIC